MVNDQIKTDVGNATVTFLKKCGRGVLVPGYLIVTAAHCIEFNLNGRMPLNDPFIEEIETIHGRFKVRPVAVEPVKDIAVLGALNNDYYPGEAAEFEEFCQITKPVLICLEEFEFFKDFAIYIFTHKGVWIEGKAHRPANDVARLWIETEEQIEPGTSGSPIINEAGQLVGIVAHSSYAAENFKGAGFSPLPHLTLPVWVVQKIKKENKL